MHYVSSRVNLHRWRFLMYGVTGQLVFLVEGVTLSVVWSGITSAFLLDPPGPTHPALDGDQPPSYPLSSNPINLTPAAAVIHTTRIPDPAFVWTIPPFSVWVNFVWEICKAVSFSSICLSGLQTDQRHLNAMVIGRGACQEQETVSECI